MAKNYSNRNRKRKALIAMLCALSVTCTGLAAACAPNEEDETSTAVTAKEDTQLLKNGDFEHFDIPDKAIHLIKNVNDWSLGGDTSVKSGIIGTSKDDWDKLTSSELADKLDYNNDLSTDNEEYVNYNSMRSRDILYKDTYAATFDGSDSAKNFKWVTEHKDKNGNVGFEGYFGIEGDDENGYYYNGEKVYKETLTDDNNNEYVDFYYEKDSTPVRKTLISNPGTHWGDFKEENGEYYFGSQKAYKDDNGNYFLDDKKETQPVGNVLMIHNAGTDTLNNGLHQYYSSTSVTLEAQTSAEISVWVKTSDLKFNKGYAADADEEDKGAYIEVVQTVSGTTIDSFQIKAINTQKIIAGAEESGYTTTESNGWLQYTIYVNACDFATSTIQLRLGLGNSENDEKVTGYAFFDDVQVTKYRDLTDEKCSYSDEIAQTIKTNKTSCTLTSEEDEKIFYADASSVEQSARHAYDFHYLIDLASETGMGANYKAIAFDQSVKVGLTTEKDSKGTEYAAALTNGANISGVSTKDQTGNSLNLPKDVKERPTANDVITVFGKDKTFGAADFNGENFSTLLNNLTGEKGAHNLPAADGGNTLVMFSAWGAPYTATISNSAFTFDRKDEYLLVSFWVKTSDMNGGTAATVKIYELDDNGEVNENSVQTLTVDTTGNTTDFENEKDIYNGWVQCFVFVKNGLNDKDENGDYINKTFYMDFSFGTTSVMSATSFDSGYAAIANLQTLEIDEDIYNLATSSSTTALFSFASESEKEGGTPIDEATGNYDVNDGIAVPDSYTGVNGANVLGSLKDKDADAFAGLINRDVFNDSESVMTPEEKDRILKSFISSATNWNDVFGSNCYQPLIIINNLREYAVKADANAENFTDYLIKDDDGNFKEVPEGAKFEDYDTYYTYKDVANYGFIGESKTVSSTGREVIGVRVKVTGDAVAYIYLIDDDTDEVLNFTTPSYTFWYDEEGNVLDEELDEDWKQAEHLHHIVYTLRDDGLYDGEDGKVYANLYNLVKSYKDSKYEHNEFYERFEDNGVVTFETISFDDLKDGETYYSKNSNGQFTVADHYLCSTDGTNVYEYIDGKYYYVEITTTDDTTTEVTNLEREVTNFDAKYARYSYPEINKELLVTVDANDCRDLGDENGWVTVNFVVTAGSEDKNYHLELWSGDRNETGVEGGTYANGAVAFDYSHAPVAEDRITDYEAEIVNAYNRAIMAVDPELLAGVTGTKENIASYEKLLEGLTDAQRTAIEAKMVELGYAENSFEASYYTFTFYDSSAYVPFNAETAGDGETGYNYDPSLFNEQLAYLRFEDTSRNEKNVFVDYSAVDQSISKNTVADDDDTEEEDTTNSTELGLYISSIVLVVVLLITLISILVTQYVRKLRKAKGAKNSNKNVYRKRDRYVKKLHLVKDEIVEPETSDNGEVPAETVPEAEPEVTELPEETTETTSDETTEATEENSSDEDNKE
ncbi:MAG: hypothetical protein K2O89_07720 [Clostridia bacterium]|nr:hypothetical protein [Clostridia bacterium]